MKNLFIWLFNKCPGLSFKVRCYLFMDVRLLGGQGSCSSLRDEVVESRNDCSLGPLLLVHTAWGYWLHKGHIIVAVLMTG